MFNIFFPLFHCCIKQYPLFLFIISFGNWPGFQPHNVPLDPLVSNLLNITGPGKDSGRMWTASKQSPANSFLRRDRSEIARRILRLLSSDLEDYQGCFANTNKQKTTEPRKPWSRQNDRQLVNCKWRNLNWKAVRWQNDTAGLISLLTLVNPGRKATVTCTELEILPFDRSSFHSNSLVESRVKTRTWFTTVLLYMKRSLLIF